MVAALLLVAVIALDVWLHAVGPLPGERAVGQWAMQWRPGDVSRDFARALLFFDTLATPYIAAATVAAAALIVAEQDGRRWGLIVAAASGVVILSAILKHVLGPTPLWVELRDSGRNYPSGHMAYATALFGCLALVTWRHRRRAATIALVAILPLMAVDRVVTGAHLPSDVIGGFLVGAAWLITVVAVAAPARRGGWTPE
jgi:undecaprenyl-diphosphatase